MNRSLRLATAVVLVLGLAAVAALLADRAATGTDDQAAKQIGNLTGEAYEPWAQAPGVPGGERNAPLLFGVQAGAGLTVLLGCLWYWREHRSEA
ncbi:MAG TPA: cobalt ABC transporter substrate-binding protein CbiN [Methanoregulaceae archaeon]|nr:cobalt ABC transporter substrate-binding protein CbiN [Methanoregulaceae archaeon]